MLPQMMPLPWLMVFFAIFSCVYSVSLFINSFSFSSPLTNGLLKVAPSNLPW